MELYELFSLPEHEEKLQIILKKTAHLANEAQRQVMGYAPCTCDICKEYYLNKLKEAQSMLNKERGIGDWDEVLVP